MAEGRDHLMGSDHFRRRIPPPWPASGNEAGTARKCDTQSNSVDPSILVGGFDIAGHKYLVYQARGAPRSPVAGTLMLNGYLCRIVEDVDAPAAVERDPIELLTARELQIVGLVARGQPTKRIAHHLRISEWTVQTHLRRIYAKLGVAGRAEMVFRCARVLDRNTGAGSRARNS